MSTILASLNQEPPKPTFDAPGISTGFLTIVAIAFITMIVVAVLLRRKSPTPTSLLANFKLSILDFGIFFLALVAGLIIGSVLASPISVGLAMVIGTIALLVSIVADFSVRLLVGSRRK